METARISNPDAEAHLVDVLQRRRDKIGRHWFDKVNPLDRFSVTSPTEAPVAEKGSAGSGGTVAGPSVLQFEDLAVTGDLEPAAARRYTYRMHLNGNPIGASRTTEETQLPLTVEDTALGAVLDERGRSAPKERVVRIDLRTWQDETGSDPTRVYVHVPSEGPPRVVGLERR